MGIIGKFLDIFIKKKIYVVGDSHVSLFSGVDKIVDYGWIKSKIRHKKAVFFTNKLGAVLAFNLMNKTFFWDTIHKIRRQSTIILVFGEIDCRVHLLKNDNVKECTDRYFDVIKKIALDYPVMVFCPVASTIGMHENGDEYAAFGTCFERNIATHKFNTLLKQRCNEINVPTIDILQDLITIDGITNMDFYFDEIHLSQKTLPLVFKHLKL